MNATSPNLQWRDIHLAVVAFDIALADLARKGQTEHPAFSAYVESRKHFAAAIRENAPPRTVSTYESGGGPNNPPVLDPAPATITAADVARHLGRPVSKIRDDGGKVLLAWVPGVGCRFVSRRKVREEIAGGQRNKSACGPDGPETSQCAVNASRIVR